MNTKSLLRWFAVRVLVYGGARRGVEAARAARGLLLVAGIVSLATQLFTASPAVAATTLPVLWTAGGLSAGNDSAGQAARIATDASGNVAVVSGPSGGRDLAVTSYTADGILRWRSTVTPALGTFVGDWVAAAPNGDFVAIGHNQDSHGRPIQSTMVRYDTDGTLLWRVDFSSGFYPAVARLVIDAAGNEYLAWSAVGSGFLVQKYSPSGALLWSQQDSSTGGGYAIASSLALSPDGADVAVSGSISGGATWITAVYNATTGVRRWQVAAAEGTAALDVIVEATRVYVAGQGNVGTSWFLAVVAYDRATGARLWRTDANPPTCCAYGSRIALAPDGSLVVAGQTSSGGYFDWWIVALDSNGAVRWQARRDAAVTGDEIPAAVFVLADGTTVVSGTGGPVTRDILGNSYMQGVTAGYSSNGALLWEAFSKLPTVWATALPNGDVCATGGYDAPITCWQVPGGVVNQPPTAMMTASPLVGVAPLTVTFDGSGSSDPDGTIASYSWNFGDGGNSTGANPRHTYASAGTSTATLTVTDNAGSTASASVAVTVTAATAGTLRSTAINLSGTRVGSRVTVSGQVVVRNAANAAVSGVSVNATWRKPDGTSATQIATTGSSGTASLSTSGGRGTYTLTVNNLTKAGYTFDRANSVLTKTITK